MEMGIDYLSTVMIFSMGLLAQICFERLLTSTGRTIFSMTSQLCGAITNIILDPILIFGLIGFPKMGVTGAAVATVIGQCVGALVSFTCNHKFNPDVRLQFRGFRPDGRIIRTIYAIGIPSIIMQSIGSVMTYSMNRILITFSSTATAVFGVYFKLQSFFFMPVFGLNNGITPIIAFNYGAQNRKRMVKTIKLSMATAFCIMLFGFLCRDIAALCEKVAGQANVTMDEIAAIGVGVPGICDAKTGIIPFCTNLGWHDVPFIAEMHKYLPNRVIVDNDATVAGYAESIAGVSRGTQSSVFITLGTGVGGGIVIGGRPYSGAHGIGSEIGHMIIKMDGEPCTCGNKGCFERYASATAIIREAKRAVEKHPESAILARCGGNPEKINAKIVIDCAKEGDATAKQVFDDYVKALAHGIVSIFNMLDPEVIVLGGGVSMAGEYLLDAVRAAVKPLVFFKTLPYPSIQLARLGADAGIIGAALLGRA